MTVTPILESPVIAASTDKNALPEWTSWERIGFRFAFFFIIQLLAPVRLEWWKRITGLHSLKEIYSVGMGLGFNYITLRNESSRWGIGSFTSWGIAAAIALLGASIWTWFARNSPRKEYNKLSYWLRLAVRYWVAFLTMEYGYYKIFPMQMPFPSISNLHTHSLRRTCPVSTLLAGCAHRDMVRGILERDGSASGHADAVPFYGCHRRPLQHDRHLQRRSWKLCL